MRISHKFMSSYALIACLIASISAFGADSSTVEGTEMEVTKSTDTEVTKSTDTEVTKSTDTEVTNNGEPEVTKKPRRKMMFKPPRRGAPKTRVGGGVRGANDSLPTLTVLVPEQTGLTISEQPSLFWYQSKPSAIQFEITLIKGFETVLEVTHKDARNAGIQWLNLADHGIKLDVGTDYEWNIALVPDPEQGAMDVTSTGTIQRVKVSPELAEDLKKAAVADRAYVLASHGIWYDALGELSSGIEKNAADSDARSARAALLEQVGLLEAAKYDRN